MMESGTQAYPGRNVLVIAFITLWSSLILARLVQLQVFQHREFTQLALQRQQVTRSLLAPRGIIYDSRLDELATSVTVSTIVAEPRRIQDVSAAARSLAAILGMQADGMESRLRDPSRQTFQVIKRRISPKEESRIESLNVDGIYLVDESMRVYPSKELASHALGFVNMNGDGGAGLELEHDKELKGMPGQISFNVDARRRSFRGTVERPPVQGHSLILSLDRSIQYVAERELTAGVQRYQAAAGVAIVMESDTGRILAMTSYPDFNSNAYSSYAPDLWRNRAVSDMFEPGSTFKVVVAAAALEAGLTRPDEVIDCQMGSIKIGRHVFHDHHPYGLLTFTQILENSSNVGAAKLGLRLGEQRLHEALRRFGFGSRSGIDLPGEIIGLVRDWRSWSGLSIGAISFGQEVGVTPLQMLVAINSIANGGYRVKPSMVDRVIDHNGDLVRSTTPQRSRIMSPETAAAVRQAFEGVVLRGTGRRAALEGYRAAGKTGTAQKIVDGRYSNTKYVASFIGFAPLPQPRVTVLVQIDEPKGAIYGGEVSAPVFQRIAQEALLQLNVPPDNSLPAPKLDPTLASAHSEDFLPNATPIVPLVADDRNSRSITLHLPSESILMPDFVGLAKRTVINRCQDLGIQVRAVGAGIAVFQAPPPGSRISLGDSCSVTFARGNLSSHRKVPGLDTARDAPPDPSAHAGESESRTKGESYGSKIVTSVPTRQ
jgi:cell division protein FtsI (penicillin-binding protein 3)